MDLLTRIRDIPDFPEPGIVFKDITPLLRDPEAMSAAAAALAAPFVDGGVDAVVGVESRGFIFGCLVARELACGFVPIRKPGKLPAETRRQDYELEYGTDAIEIHADSLTADDSVLLVDDLLATGGTLRAAEDLVAGLGAQVLGSSVLIELAFLNGRSRLVGPCHAVLTVD